MYGTWNLLGILFCRCTTTIRQRVRGVFAGSTAFQRAADEEGNFVIRLILTAISGRRIRATITGFIMDAFGAFVADTSVTITNVNTNESRGVQTRSTGIHAINNLFPGVYRRLSVASGNTGFLPVRQGKYRAGNERKRALLT